MGWDGMWWGGVVWDGDGGATPWLSGAGGQASGASPGTRNFNKDIYFVGGHTSETSQAPQPTPTQPMHKEFHLIRQMFPH